MLNCIAVERCKTNELALPETLIFVLMPVILRVLYGSHVKH